MKTTKSILLVALFVFSTVGFSQTEKTNVDSEPIKISKTLKIHILDAQQNKSLSMAIYRQVSPEFLQFITPGYYIFHVNFRDTDYVVYGLHKHWRHFFRP